MTLMFCAYHGYFHSIMKRDGCRLAVLFLKMTYFSTSMCHDSLEWFTIRKKY